MLESLSDSKVNRQRSLTMSTTRVNPQQQTTAVVRIDIILCANNTSAWCFNSCGHHTAHTRYIEAAVYVHPIIELRVKDKASIFALVRELLTYVSIYVLPVVPPACYSCLRTLDIGRPFRRKQEIIVRVRPSPKDPRRASLMLVLDLSPLSCSCAM